MEEKQKKTLGHMKERGEKTIFYNIIKHWVIAVFSNALGNTVTTQRCWLNLRKLMWVCFCGFYEIFPKLREGNELIFMKFSINLGKGMSQANSSPRRVRLSPRAPNLIRPKKQIGPKKIYFRPKKNFIKI